MLRKSLCKGKSVRKCRKVRGCKTIKTKRGRVYCRKNRKRTVKGGRRSRRSRSGRK